MPAAVVSDHAIALIEEEHHLVVPIIGRERPAVAENDGLTFAPVLIINFDSVFRCNRGHMTSLSGCKSVGRHYARIARIFCERAMTSAGDPSSARWWRWAPRPRRRRRGRRWR